MCDFPLIARPARSTYIVFAVLGFVLLLPGLTVANDYFSHRFVRASDLVFSLVLTALYILMFVWIGAYQIVVTDSKIFYRTLFQGSRSMAFVDIESVETEVGAQNLAGPFYRLVVKSKLAEPPLIINMKIFRRQDLRLLISLLGERSASDAMRVGDF